MKVKEEGKYFQVREKLGSLFQVWKFEILAEVGNFDYGQGNL